jgi:hypothetical protein
LDPPRSNNLHLSFVSPFPFLSILIFYPVTFGPCGQKISFSLSSFLDVKLQVHGLSHDGMDTRRTRGVLAWRRRTHDGMGRDAAYAAAWNAALATAPAMRHTCDSYGDATTSLANITFFSFQIRLCSCVSGHSANYVAVSHL